MGGWLQKQTLKCRERIFTLQGYPAESRAIWEGTPELVTANQGDVSKPGWDAPAPCGCCSLLTALGMFGELLLELDLG